MKMWKLVDVQRHYDRTEDPQSLGTISDPLKILEIDVRLGFIGFLEIDSIDFKSAR